VIHERTGFLVATDKELGAKLELLIRNPQLRKSMAEAAVSHAQQFDWDVIARQWEEAFTQAVAKRRAR
jgi:glycosyltransferase involved in cell wall biosynthesis